ncbi:UNVERIFIED_CONTAM: protein phosphatase PP2A regulatory subunit A, partial [Sesamum radiatum]
VYSIRDAAANNLKRLAEEFGPDWAMQHIVPQVLDMVNNPHYLYRMTVSSCNFLARSSHGCRDNMFQLIACDCYCIKGQVVEKTIRPTLVELTEDPDVDVRFFANQALQSIDHVMMSS